VKNNFSDFLSIEMMKRFRYGGFIPIYDEVDRAKMKICYLADAGSIHTQRWIKYFADRGHEVHVISKRSCHGIEGVKLHLLKRLPESTVTSALNLLITVFQVKSLIHEIKPDLLHSHIVLDYGSYGAFSGFHPFVISAWGSDVLIVPKKSMILRALTRYALDEADLITCDGENSRSAMIDLGTDGNKIRLISHGVDTSLFNPNHRAESLRKKLEIHDSAAVISTRRLELIYDISSLIKAIPYVLKDMPDTRFIIAGEGRERANLTELAEHLEIVNSIIFTGNLNHEELSIYLASSDLYVSTSLSDSMALSTLEAMSSGLAVVVTDSGDARIWIHDGENGFVVPTRNPEKLAEKILYLLKNAGDRRRFGSANRIIIEKNADYYAEMEKVRKMYEDLVERYRR